MLAPALATKRPDGLREHLFTTLCDLLFSVLVDLLEDRVVDVVVAAAHRVALNQAHFARGLVDLHLADLTELVVGHAERDPLGLHLKGLIDVTAEHGAHPKRCQRLRHRFELCCAVMDQNDRGLGACVFSLLSLSQGALGIVRENDPLDVRRQGHLRRVPIGQPDDAELEPFDIDDDVPLDRHRLVCGHLHVGAEVAVRTGLCVSAERLDAEIELVVAHRSGAVPEVIHGFDHGLTLKQRAQRRPGPRVTARDEHIEVTIKAVILKVSAQQLKAAGPDIVRFAVAPLKPAMLVAGMENPKDVTVHFTSRIDSFSLGRNLGVLWRRRTSGNKKRKGQQRAHEISLGESVHTSYGALWKG